MSGVAVNLKTSHVGHSVSLASLPVLRVAILILICILAFIVRLFAVIRFESVIHEFDPYFNFRTTKFLTNNGFYEFWNWFDAASWYPLGRVVGQTLYPGLMTTAFLMHRAFSMFGLPFDIKDICVFTAPIFSGFTALATYCFTKETSGNRGAALFSSLFVALSPAYMSRSVAGSYDNEAVAIFALVFTFYMYTRAVNCGTTLSAALACLAYFYMVSSWGGYVFITNVVAIHGLALIALGKITNRHYVTYSVFHIIGTLLCMNIPFVNFQAVTSSEHLASHGVFFFMQRIGHFCLNYGFFQAMFLVRTLQRRVPSKLMANVTKVFSRAIFVGILLFAIWLNLTGRMQFAGRSLTLLDPTYASKYIPIIASVSEHQPPTWSNYIFDLHVCTMFAAAGIWVVFISFTDTSLFLGLYGLLAVYFSCVMVRLMLVLSPACCALAGVGLSTALSWFLGNPESEPSLNEQTSAFEDKISEKKTLRNRHSQYAGGETDGSLLMSKYLEALLYWGTRATAIGLLLFMGIAYIKHSVFASAVAYSHPSIIINLRHSHGTRFIQDDFREAYYWLRQNTHPDARLMSWWDYGYQSAAMGNRTVIVDNNTWNTTHIATVGLAFASPEEESYPLLLKLDVDYVFVIFGGATYYSGDDVNKFLWMVRIAEGPYPWIKESSYFNARNQYSVGTDAAPALRKSLLYHLSYYRFHEGATQGYDTVRQQLVPAVPPLKHLEEVYTTENWLVKQPDTFWINTVQDASLATV